MPKQTYQQILTDLQKRKFSPIYFLMGDEAYYIDQISNYIQHNLLTPTEADFNLSVFYGKDIDIRYVMETAKRYPMMADYQVVLIKEAQQIKNWDDILHYTKLPVASTILCFCYKYGKPDGRKKWFQELSKKAVILESKKLYENQVVPWIREYLKEKDTKITQKAEMMLVEFLGNDLSKLSNELDKLLITKPAEQKEITPELIEENIGISKDFNVFELLNALVCSDILKANRIIKYFGENPKANPTPLVTSQLFNFFSNLMIYHYLPNKSQQTVAVELKINPYFVKDYEQASRRFNAWKTMNVITWIRETDARSKGIDNASVSDTDLLKELVYKILH